MVQLMKNGKSESHSERMPPVKMEVEDPLEEEHGPLQKRAKSRAMGGFEVSASQYNPLAEPSPLGLRLRKSPSLLELIQMKLSQANKPKVGSHGHGKKDPKGGAASGDKLKASNFPASILQIGTWEYKSRYEGDLVAKCYFAKHKLVWEVLDGGLKNKIEFQWSDIMALKANYPDDGPGTFDVVLARQPLFFRETNPQPRKHTLWQATADFTGGQASIHRRHHMECPQGLLGKHFEKLIQCDPRLNILSQQGDITSGSPYFEHRHTMFDDQNENSEIDLNRVGSPSFFTLHNTNSSSGVQSSSSKNDQDALSRNSESYPRETPSPSSVKDAMASEDFKHGGMEQFKALSNWDQIRAPGLHSSMSMSDLVSHLESRISEHGTSSNPVLSSEDWHSLEILDDINRCLFSDLQNMPDSDEKLLMSRVNSLCCLLQKDSAAVSYSESKNDINPNFSFEQKRTDESYSVGASTSECRSGVLHDEYNETSGYNQAPAMSRKDSVGELLLNLPRIASLPQFLFNISEDLESQAR
ncbi:uncharacterized protein LOC142520580 [Primulina tabacum]|uniref:uncharacterized protein LOC142520580 n=1 Tax=Primulina tabacum TaxID=48773 RepID=UPI003F5A0AE2